MENVLQKLLYTLFLFFYVVCLGPQEPLWDQSYRKKCRIRTRHRQFNILVLTNEPPHLMFFNRWMRRRQKQHVFSLAPNWLNNSSVSVFQLWKQLINNYPIIISRFWLHGTCKPNEQEKRASEPLSEAQVNKYQPPNLSPRARYMSISLRTSLRGPGTWVSASEPLSEDQVHEYQPSNLSPTPRYMSISLWISLRGPGTRVSASESLSEAQVHEYQSLYYLKRYIQNSTYMYRLCTSVLTASTTSASGQNKP